MMNTNPEPNQKSSFKNLKTLIVPAILILFPFAFVLMLYNPQPYWADRSKLAVLLYGIGQLILILGFLASMLLCMWLWYVLAIKQTELRKAELEAIIRKDSIDKQILDAEKRRQHDQLLHYDAAIARLLESAIVKNEDVSEPEKLPENTKFIMTNRGNKVTNTRNQFDKEVYQIALDSYRSMINSQQTKTL